VHEFFPRGARFPPHDAPAPRGELPLAEAAAFSLDDVGTNEIDDAFSLQHRGEAMRVGIHIAAPALGFAPGSALDAIARERLSTAYMPGRKFTMLPDDVIQRYSLDHGGERVAVSLYFDVGADWTVGARHTRLERVPVAANLRHAQYEVLNDAFASGGSVGLPFEDELRSLWKLATALEQRRGRPNAGGTTPEYSFYVEEGRVRIVPRQRGAPLD
jgi:exoribonuclease-2